MKSLLIASTIALSSQAYAGLVDVDVNTKSWMQDVAPSSGKMSDNTWKRLGSNTPYRNGNLSGSLISDFEVSGDFNFSGSLQALTHHDFSSSCSSGNEGSCNDNDIMGLVFGWQDADNHFRLGWSQGGERSASDSVFGDAGGAGLFLVQESNGVSSLIHHWSDLFWQDDVIYDFNISRTGQAFNVGLSGQARTQAGTESGSDKESDSFASTDVNLGTDGFFSFISSAFGSGKLGVYTESQMAQFTFDTISTTPPPSPSAVNAPLTLSLLAMGMGVLQIRRKKARSSNM